MNSENSKRTTSQNIFSHVIKVDNHELRRPDVFYVGLNKKGRIYITRLIKEHGGIVLSEPVGHNVISLVDDRSKPSAAAPSVYSIQYVVDCVNSGKRLDLESYRINAPRTPGPKRGSKTKNSGSLNAKLTSPDQRNQKESTNVQIEAPHQTAILVDSEDDHPVKGSKILSNKIPNKQGTIEQTNDKQVQNCNNENDRPWSEEENEELRECIRNIITILERKKINLENIFNERLWVTLEEVDFFPTGRSSSECCRQAFKHKDLVLDGKTTNYQSYQVMPNVTHSMKEKNLEDNEEKEKEVVGSAKNVDQDSDVGNVTSPEMISKEMPKDRAKQNGSNINIQKNKRHLYSHQADENTEKHREEYRDNDIHPLKETPLSKALHGHSPPERGPSEGKTSVRPGKQRSEHLQAHRNQPLNQDDHVEEVSSSQETQEPTSLVQQKEHGNPRVGVPRRQRSNPTTPRRRDSNQMHVEDTPVALDHDQHITKKRFPHQEIKHLNKSLRRKTTNKSLNQGDNLKPSQRVSSHDRPFKRQPKNKSQLRIFLLVRDIACEARVSEKHAFQALRQAKGDPNRALRVLQREKR